MDDAIYVGFDPREAEAFWITCLSIKRHLSSPITIQGLELWQLEHERLYTRPYTRDSEGRLYDVISQHPMSTEFAISRFLVPHLMYYRGWALFLDCDMLIREDLTELFQLRDPKYAVMCVKHDHRPAGTVKMDNQTQSRYFRKNWSSACLFNCGHPSNRYLTVEYVNSATGRDLHAFNWLEDDEIGELPTKYNHLVGYSPPQKDVAIAHFTEGGPWLKGYERVPFADEWLVERRIAGNARF